MKNNIENTFFYENINLTQLMLHTMDENKYNASLLSNLMSIQKIHNYLINLIHQVNDKGNLNEVYLNNICQFLVIEGINTIDDLIAHLDRRRIESDGLNHLRLYELQNYVQCIKFLAKDSCVDLNRILEFSDFTNTVRKMNQIPLSSMTR